MRIWEDEDQIDQVIYHRIRDHKEWQRLWYAATEDLDLNCAQRWRIQISTMLSDEESRSQLCSNGDRGLCSTRRIQISAILNNKDPDLSYAQLGGRVEWDPAKRSEKEVRLSGTQPSVNVDKLDEQMGR